MEIANRVLESHLDAKTAKNYRNGLTAALMAAYSVLSYRFWIVGDLSIDTTGIFFSAVFVFIVSQYLYDRGS